jgi:hypothetical protein
MVPAVIRGKDAGWGKCSFMRVIEGISDGLTTVKHVARGPNPI